MFPKFLIRKMYKGQSLVADSQGFLFVIKNNLANGKVVEVFHLLFNEVEIPFDKITVANDTQEMIASEITLDNPIDLKKGIETTFRCIYEQALKNVGEEIKISMKFKVKVRDSSMTIDFDFKDIMRSGEN